MRCWAATVSEEMFAGERLYAFDSLVLPEPSHTSTGAPSDGDSCDVIPDSVPRDSVARDSVARDSVAPGSLARDRVAPGGVSPGDVVALVVAGESPLLFGLGRVRERHAAKEELAIAYTHRIFDDPLPVGDLPLGPVQQGLTELDPSLYARLAGRVSAQPRGDADRSQWLVCVALPIEAASRAEAVREFWTYLAKHGPRELPAFVWPQGDELAMQAFVLGEEANLDPEEE
ncbi:MAG: hypothetical protein QOE61_1094 [Micromonosporaceae bacterium]|nr:hypothetical protein [Micromonosporaceae bacterium]